MTNPEVRTRIRGFIEANAAQGQTFSDDDNLFMLGIIDSFGVGELMAFLEQTFAVKIPDDLYFDKRFATLSGLADIIGDLAKGT